jgi:hypothetical protein
LAEIEKTHPIPNRKLVHKSSHDLESRLQDMTKNNQQSHHISSGSSSSHVSKSSNSKDELGNPWNKQGNIAKDRPAHRPSVVHKSQPQATDPPFHHWREFVDNNPKYGKAKLATEKPTTKTTHKMKSTKPFHQWREFLDNNSKYTHKPKPNHPTNPQLTPKTKPANGKFLLICIYLMYMCLSFVLNSLYY